MPLEHRQSDIPVLCQELPSGLERLAVLGAATNYAGDNDAHGIREELVVLFEGFGVVDTHAKIWIDRKYLTVSECLEETCVNDVSGTDSGLGDPDKEASCRFERPHEVWDFCNLFSGEQQNSYLGGMYQ